MIDLEIITMAAVVVASLIGIMIAAGQIILAD